ncbi:FUSC family protein, partial [Leclercia adecarboxylata]
AYIVAQPLAGAVSSKAMFRLLGTVIGAGVAILLVPLLGNAPELLSLALALWLGLCTFVALLDRTPRAYTFLLAGYTAGIVAFPAVEAQATIFTAASLRAQEIGIGIASATLVHSLVFPRTVSARLQARIDAIMIDAERWSRDSLRVDHG